MLTRVRLVAFLVAALVAAACAVGGGGGSPSDDPSSPADSGQAERRPNVEEFQDDIEGAVAVADAYWTDRFRAAGQRFTPIRRVFPYRAEGEVACGAQAVPANNAAYCPDGDFIAYDVNWAVRAYAQVGDAFLYFLLGHEYAHGIQVRLGLRYEYTIEQELQADCLAGAYIGDSVKADRLTLEDGDLDELRQGLQAVGDDPGQPWFAEGSHGSPEQRTDSFFKGYEQSTRACDI
jgi:uncharacterized protein